MITLEFIDDYKKQKILFFVVVETINFSLLVSIKFQLILLLSLLLLKTKIKDNRGRRKEIRVVGECNSGEEGRGSDEIVLSSRLDLQKQENNNNLKIVFLLCKL